MRWVVAIVAAVSALAGSVAQADAASVKRTGKRAHELTVATPSSPDLSVVRLDFALGRRTRRGMAPMRMRAAAPGVDIAIVGGRLLPARGGRISALVVVSHRHPAGALFPDVAQVRVAVAGARLTQRPALDEVPNAFAARSHQTFAAPVMCRDHAGAVGDGGVARALNTGAALPFTAAHVLSQAYDVACSRPVDPVFEQAFTLFDRCPPCDPRAEPGRVCPLYACIEPARRRAVG